MRVFRKLLPVEAPALCDHLLRLSRDDRALRFMGALSDDAVAGHCRGIDWRRTLVIGFFDEARLRGVAEFHVTRTGLPVPDVAGEVAVTVEHAWRGQGVGTELVRHVLLVARNRGVRRLRMSCLLENQPMRRVARKLAADLLYREGEAEAALRIPFPTGLTLWQEAATDGFGLLAAWAGRVAAHGLIGTAGMPA